jgi:hypothetical protein
MRRRTASSPAHGARQRTAACGRRWALGAGHLSLADFEALLDRNPLIEQVELSNYGEMFLNPQLADILDFAPPGPGTYTMFIRPLGSRGWMPAVSRLLEIAPRPICQEFELNVPERSVRP